MYSAASMERAYASGVRAIVERKRCPPGCNDEYKFQSSRDREAHSTQHIQKTYLYKLSQRP